MVDARDGTRRSQRDETAVVTGPGDIDPADLPDDPAEAVLEALPEPLRIALERAIAETDATVRQVVLDAQEAGQTVNEVIRDQFDQFIPDEGEVPDEEDGEDDDGTSIADLVGEAEPEVFDRTFLVEKEDAPASTGDPWPIPQPWQGLPRLAFVVNLNYVYDEENEEWVRQGPFSGGAGSGFTVVDTRTTTVPANGVAAPRLGITDATLPLTIFARFPDEKQVNEPVQLYQGREGVPTSIAYQLGYVDKFGEWQIRAVGTGLSNNIDVEFTTVEASFI